MKPVELTEEEASVVLSNPEDVVRTTMRYLLPVRGRAATALFYRWLDGEWWMSYPDTLAAVIRVVPRRKR